MAGILGKTLCDASIRKLQKRLIHVVVDLGVQRATLVILSEEEITFSFRTKNVLRECEGKSSLIFDIHESFGWHEIEIEPIISFGTVLFP